MKPPSGSKKTNPIKANFFKGQNRLPENLATPLFSPASIIAQHQLASGYEYFFLN
jgi:hypothetical protein